MTPGPHFAGFPDKVRLSDWLLVEWVATAKKGAAFPEPEPLTTTRRQTRGRPYGI